MECRGTSVSSGIGGEFEQAKAQTKNGYLKSECDFLFHSLLFMENCERTLIVKYEKVVCAGT